MTRTWILVEELYMNISQSWSPGMDLLLYLIAANGTLMEMVATDWLKSDKQEDELGGRPGGIVQIM
ncbi:hypothetical protein Cni_G19675 [Canna indica]|uniref:Uncharacterized protein n=1 Tax=Canna indica TaxID=4628 RepID=A0AAQ3KRU0_9LILI|nr:hypothetical protein Cni_G19675 [Canna indica]